MIIGLQFIYNSSSNFVTCIVHKPLSFLYVSMLLLAQMRFPRWVRLSKWLESSLKGLGYCLLLHWLLLPVGLSWLRMWSHGRFPWRMTLDVCSITKSGNLRRQPKKRLWYSMASEKNASPGSHAVSFNFFHNEARRHHTNHRSWSAMNLSQAWIKRKKKSKRAFYPMRATFIASNKFMKRASWKIPYRCTVIFHLISF
jgi:hypothetical protein